MSDEVAEDDFSTIFAELPEEEKNAVAKDIYDELLDVVVFGQCLEFHRAIKLGYFNEEESDREDQQQYRGNDALGGPVSNLKCACPICKSKVEAEGFARHLGYCMGCRRESSRKAKEGITSSYKDRVLSDEDCIEEPVSKTDDDDGEWNDRKTKKKKGKNIRKNKKK